VDDVTARTHAIIIIIISLEHIIVVSNNCVRPE
jgi:hypothetical protein